MVPGPWVRSIDRMLLLASCPALAMASLCHEYRDTPRGTELLLGMQYWPHLSSIRLLIFLRSTGGACSERGGDIFIITVSCHGRIDDHQHWVAKLGYLCGIEGTVRLSASASAMWRSIAYKFR
ncbi:hypothetical protein M758_3G041400 [Ceratodon purpureus]|nr:hypothetical protein M758_3G041400 [Ceratodon purpureus]